MNRFGEALLLVAGHQLMLMAYRKPYAALHSFVDWIDDL